VSTETFQRYVFDVCASAGEWGIENVLLLNGHYLAQDPELDIVVRRLRQEAGITAFQVSLIDLFAEVAAEIRTADVSFHASEFETSIMLALLPELVHMERAESVDPPSDPLPLTDYDALGDDVVGWSLTAAEMAEITPTGTLGDPTVATATKGEALVEAAVSGIRELVDALEQGTNSPEGDA